jgi:uracil-DNA glycosylase
MTPKSVPDFIPDHISDPDYLIVGLSPSSKTKPFKNGTFARLQHWTQEVALPHWDFYNILSEVNCTDIKKVDSKELAERCNDRKKIVALGGIVSKVLNKHGIQHHRVDHPSPRNRNLNSKEYEKKMLSELRNYIHA